MSLRNRVSALERMADTTIGIDEIYILNVPRGVRPASPQRDSEEFAAHRTARLAGARRNGESFVVFNIPAK